MSNIVERRDRRDITENTSLKTGTILGNIGKRWVIFHVYGVDEINTYPPLPSKLVEKLENYLFYITCTAEASCEEEKYEKMKRRAEEAKKELNEEFKLVDEKHYDYELPEAILTLFESPNTFVIRYYISNYGMLEHDEDHIIYVILDKKKYFEGDLRRLYEALKVLLKQYSSDEPLPLISHPDHFIEFVKNYIQLMK